jgi:hypothetical protein
LSPVVPDGELSVLPHAASHAPRSSATEANTDSLCFVTLHLPRPWMALATAFRRDASTALLSWPSDVAQPEDLSTAVALKR